MQKYTVYRFNGNTFDSVKLEDDSIPMDLGNSGTTSKWFTPSSIMSTAFRYNQKELIAFNYNEKSINKLDIKIFTNNKISNRYWARLIAYEGKDSRFYSLIELKTS